LLPIIEAKQLTKTFNGVPAVDDLSFTIQPGDIYGFLGQNGAGKSTTMRMLLGLIRPDAGTIKIKGEDFTHHKRQLLRYIGAIIERPDMYGYLSGWDNLKMFARLSGGKIPDSRLHELLKLVSLNGRETNGLDPQGIAEMRHLIINLSKEHGKTILISSHLLYEIEQMATRMIIIHKGRKIVEGPVAELLNPHETLMQVSIVPDERIAVALQQSAWQSFLQSQSPGSFTLKMHPQDVPALNQWLVANGAQVQQLQARHSLEAYFLTLTHDAATTHRAL